jgi:hypothetical protein
MMATFEVLHNLSATECRALTREAYRELVTANPERMLGRNMARALERGELLVTDCDDHLTEAGLDQVLIGFYLTFLMDSAGVLTAHTPGLISRLLAEYIALDQAEVAEALREAP